MIAIFYLLAPLLLKIDRQAKIYGLLPVFMVVSILIPRPYETTRILHAFLHFFSVYLFGMFCSHYKGHLLSVVKRYSAWLGISILTLALLEIHQPSEQFGYSPYNYLQKMACCPILVYGLQRVDSAIPNKIRSIGNTLAELSFGIYFIHYYFLYAFKEASWLHSLQQGTLLSLAILFMLTTLLCIFSLQIAKKVTNGQSRVLLGC